MDPRNIVRRVDWLWRQHHPLHGEGDEIGDTLVTIIERIDQVESNPSPGSAGAYIHLLRVSNQSIDTAATEAVQWDTFHGVIGPSDFPPITLPTTDITIMKPGYYDVVVGLAYENQVTDPALSITRERSDEVTVWPPASDPGLWSHPLGRRFEGLAGAIPCEEGDIIRVYVSHGEASGQNLTGWVVVKLEDRSLPGGSDPYRDLILSQGPIAYWRLGEPDGATTAVDSSGNGHHGTYNGAALVLGMDGALANNPNTAVQFTEATATDYVDVGDDAALEFSGTSSFTLKAWVKVTSDFSDWRVVIQKTGFGSSPTGKWLLGVNSTAGAVAFRCLRQDGSGSDSAATSASFNQDQWYHVAATYDGTNITVYVDGVQAAQIGSTRSLADSAGAVRIGRGEGNGIDAVCDEIAVWGRALALAETTDQVAVGRSG